MELTKDIVQIIRNKPPTFKENQFEWRKLIKSILTPPDKDFEWIKNQKGEWERIKLG